MSKRRAEKADSVSVADGATGPAMEQVKPKNKKPASAMHGFGAALAVMTSLPTAVPVAAPSASKPAAGSKPAGAKADKPEKPEKAEKAEKPEFKSRAATANPLAAQASALLAEKHEKQQKRRESKLAAAATKDQAAEAPELSAKLKKRLASAQGRAAPDGASALAEAKARARERERRRQKKLLLAKDHVGASFSELERKLLRVATKGVVTLFNVVAKQQRELSAVEAAATTSSTKDRRTTEIAQTGFVEMLRASSKTAAAAGAQAAAAAPKGRGDDSDASDGSDDAAAAAGASASAKAKKGLAWKALDEDYLMGKNKMREWDATDSSEESSD